MNSKSKILFLLILFFLFSAITAQERVSADTPLLFTDREYCISGDTIRIKVHLSNAAEEKNNVARVQLNALNGNTIQTLALISNKGWANGYMFIPDSLSTGMYFISCFLNYQRVDKELAFSGKTLFVYNRFDENISELTIPDEPIVKQVKSTDLINISADKEEYSTRENVNVEIIFKSDGIKNPVISASLFDPLSHNIGGRINVKGESLYPEIPFYHEKNGLVISGHVLNSENEPQKNQLVLLSIPGDQPYFDYYLSGETGDYHFLLKNAFGNANLVLQVVTNSGIQMLLQPCVNQLKTAEKITTQVKILTPEESGFITDIIQSNFYKKIFNPVALAKTDSFYMPKNYEMPFYGTPSKRIIPDEFIDLPDFREISRELLPGVQYRIKNNEVTFRMVNETQGLMFQNEPLRLLNGIPVFKNNLLSSLQSSDIKYIDIVQKQRIFGDLIFNGILCVTLYNQSNSWIGLQPNLFQYKTNCIQINQEPAFQENKISNINIPDIRTTYLFDVINSTNSKFSFRLSDLKGRVKITVEGLTSNNEVFKTSKVITVK